MTEMTLPDYNDVAAAAERIADYANKTPVMTSRTVNEEFGAEVFFKCENFQRMGAFKFRGAMNALRQFTPQQRAAGVVTFFFRQPCTGHCLVGKVVRHSSNNYHAA